MTTTKKILGIVMAVVMIFGCFTLAFAADTDAASVAVTAGTTTLAAGESTTITVKATANFAAATISIPVFYDKTLVSVSEVTAGTLTGGTITTNTDATSAMSDKVFANTGLSSTQYGFVIATFIASPGATVSSTLDGSVFVTFKVTAKADVSGTAAVKVVEGSKKTSSNLNGTLYFGSSTTGATVTGTAENVENIDITNSSITIDIGETMVPADLALTTTGSTAGVIIDTHKTFGGTYAGVVYGFKQAATTTFRSTAYLTNNLQVTNGGTMEFARSIGTAGYGTGTTITVKNSDGSVEKIYVVVIFGDVNGDGLINANDTTALKAAVQSSANAPANSVKRMAANCQNLANATLMHTLNANDTAALKNHVNGSAKFEQSTLATRHNTYNNFYQ